MLLLLSNTSECYQYLARRVVLSERGLLRGRRAMLVNASAPSWAANSMIVLGFIHTLMTRRK